MATTQTQLAEQAGELLDKLAKVRLKRELLERKINEKQEAILKPVRQKIDKLMGPYTAQLKKLQEEFNQELKELTEREAKIEPRIKELIVANKKTVNGTALQAVYYKPKVTYNIDKLEAMREFVPQLNSARTEADQGSCQIRKVPAGKKE